MFPIGVCSHNPSWFILLLHRFPSSISNRAASSITSSPFVFIYPHIFTTHTCTSHPFSIHCSIFLIGPVVLTTGHCNRNGTRTASSLGLCSSDRACVCSSACSLILSFVFRPNERGERNDLRCGFGLAGERAGELIWWLLA